MHPINAGLWGRTANITVKASHGNWGKASAYLLGSGCWLADCALYVHRACIDCAWSSSDWGTARTGVACNQLAALVCGL